MFIFYSRELTPFSLAAAETKNPSTPMSALQQRRLSERQYSMAKPGADEASAKRKKAAEEESESSSDDEAGPQPAAPGQLGEDSDTDGEAGPPAPAPVKQKKKRKLAHEKVCVCIALCWRSRECVLCRCDACVAFCVQRTPIVWRWSFDRCIQDTVVLLSGIGVSRIDGCTSYGMVLWRNLLP